MSKKNAFNTVTPLSKAIALVMFITFPFIGFYLGMQYQKELDRPFINDIYKKEEVACTLEAKICPDGSSVGRTGPNCEFKKCPD